ncbi:hypothetical protein ACFV0D_15960, partial [Streptomyces sp. NPDC059556]
MMRVKALPDGPRWAVLAAHAVPLVTLPSGLWRLALVAGFPVTRDAGWRSMGLGESVYVVSLSVVSELLAFLTLGLVRSWGEVFPRWMPFLGGRRVNPAAGGGGGPRRAGGPGARAGSGGPPPPAAAGARTPSAPP